MTTITNEFDNLTGVSQVKDFEQSKIKDVHVLDEPEVYQEFDTIENEIDNSKHGLNEVSVFAEQLQDARVVCQNDAIALESLIGELSELPHVNSYTQDYSLVNYQITQESAFRAIFKAFKAILKKIYGYIQLTIEYIREMLSKVFKKNAYTDSTKKQNEVKKTLKIAKTNISTVQSTSDAVKSGKDDNTRAARVVAINKQLRNLLYPKFNELKILSLGGEININLLVDEMCHQRLKPFYSTFFKAIYDNNLVLKTTVSLLARRVESDFGILITKTTDLFMQDITQPPSTPYERMYLLIPEQLENFISEFGDNTVKPTHDDLYQAIINLSFDIAKSITSISTTHELPEDRAILNLDLDWLGELFDTNTNSIGQDIQQQFTKLNKEYKVLERNADQVHPELRSEIMKLYSDWMIINKMAMILAIFRSRTDSIYQNIDLLSTLIIETTDIASN